ncbi:SCO6745 family protein [Herbidospora sp. RD11066]
MYKKAIGSLGGRFMISREVRALCEETGLGRWEMYFRGRCGVLGEVDAEVVVAVALFFEPGFVRAQWESGRSLPAEKAAFLYAQACANWGRRNLAFDGAGRLADLLTKATSAASPLAAPLFAGWRALPLPEDAPARAAHALQVAREHRGAMHSIAVAAGLIDPLMATLVGSEESGAPRTAASTAEVARFLSWPEPYPVPAEEDVEKRARAEELTDVLVAPAYSVLTGGEAEELGELLREAEASVK